MKSTRLVALASCSALLVVAGSACGSFSSSSAAPGEADAAATDAPVTGDGAVPGDASGGEAGDVDGATVSPFEIANGLTDLEGVAMTDSTVYVLEHDPGHVLAIPISGGAPSVIEANAGSPLGIAVANSSLYWTNFGGSKLNTVPLSGGAGPSAITLAGKNPFAIAPASDRIVVLSLEAGDAGDLGEVQQYTFNLLPGPSVPGLQNPFDVAVFGSNIFWTEAASGGRIGRGTTGQSSSVALADGETDAQSIAADASGVYWAQPSLNRVRAYFSTGTTTIAGGETAPHSLVTDATSIYWLTGDGKLRRLAKSSAAPAKTLASGFMTAFAQMRVRALAQNAKYLVWITTDGRVLRLAK